MTSQAEVTTLDSVLDKLRAVERRWEENEGRLRAILDSATDYAIFTTDEEGIVTSWNEGARRILGWHEDEIVGQDVRVVFTPEDRDAGAPERERQTAAARGRAEDERWHARRDGSRFWASGVLMPLRTGPAGFLKILRDRSEEKKTGTALYESEVLKGAILEAALDCIVTIDPDSRIVEWNPAAEHTFGYLRGVALGQDISEIPSDYAEMAKLDKLGFTSPEEMLSERFHMDIDLFKTLNNTTELKAGATIIVANIEGPEPDAKVARIEADKAEAQLRAFDAEGKLIAAYPATIGSEENPSPSGVHQVNAVAPEPVYYYRPEKNFQQGDNTEPLDIPPGPNNPVGSVWIDLSEPTYGIHGTPEPSKIDKTGSHGCVRLTNWDAEELAGLVEKGTRVEFVE